MHRTLSVPRARWATVACVALLSIAVAVVPAGAAGAPKWTLRATPATSDFAMHWLACSSTGCVAMAQSCSPGGCGGLLPGKAYGSANDGASWKTGTFPGTNPKGIACGSATFCVAAALTGRIGHTTPTIDVTKNAGASWAVHSEAAWAPSTQACASATTCVLFASPAQGSFFDTEQLRTTNAGNSWIATKFTSIKGYVYGAACSSATQCVAVGTTENFTPLAFLSVNGGASWKQVGVPTGAGGSLKSVTCNGLVCIAMTSTSAVISKNGGKSWSVHALPMGKQLQGAACLTGSECVLVGYSTGSRLAPAAYLTKNGGASWTLQSLPHATGALLAVACPSTTACAVVGERLTYSGATATYEYPLAYTY